MNVQPYFPEPIEIPGNVADESYPVRLKFIRTVSWIYFSTVVLCVGVVFAIHPFPDLKVWSILLVISLLCLSLIRQLFGFSRIHVILSVPFLAAVLLTTAGVSRLLFEQGWPIWSVGIAAACSQLYTLACGRDFSFMGKFFLSAIGAVGISAVIILDQKQPWSELAIASIMIATYLVYHVYDFAAMLRRRRAGDEWLAVVDLYRDVLNLITYGVRVIQHWRKFRI